LWPRRSSSSTIATIGSGCRRTSTTAQTTTSASSRRCGPIRRRSREEVGAGANRDDQSDQSDEGSFDVKEPEGRHGEDRAHQGELPTHPLEGHPLAEEG